MFPTAFITSSYTGSLKEVNLTISSINSLVIWAGSDGPTFDKYTYYQNILHFIHFWWQNLTRVRFSLTAQFATAFFKFAMFSFIWHREHDLITFPCNLCYLYYNWMKLICKHNIQIQTLETPSAAEKEIKRIKIRNS